MARRASSFRNRSKGPRRLSLWLQGVATRTTLAAANTASIVTQLNAAALALRPFTVVRTRGYMHVESDQSAASESQELSLGVVVVTAQASAIGATAVPTPETDDAADWMVYERIFNSFLFGDATGFNTPAGRFHMIDSKAMRKVDNDSDLLQVIESGTIGAGLIATTYLRTLIKLH